MKSVIQQQNINSLIDTYRKCFFKKYNKDPKLGKWDAEAFRYLLNQASFDEINDAMEHYFSMKDEWFTTKAYDVGTFKDNFNKVLASQGEMEVSQAQNSGIAVCTGLSALLWTLGYYYSGGRLYSRNNEKYTPVPKEEADAALRKARKGKSLALDGSEDFDEYSDHPGIKVKL